MIILWTLMNRESFGTIKDYMRALQSALTDAHPKHREMLLAHFNAPHHTTTWAQLAEEVGYKEGRAVNLQYGKFGERVARQLGLNGKPLDPNGNRWWVWCLVHWAGERDPISDHTAFVLRPEVVTALERLGYKKKTSKRKPNPALLGSVQPDDKLAAIVGSQPLTREELTKKLWNYIKKHGCQDKKNRPIINADDLLRPIFNGKSQVSMVQMAKLVSMHLR